ncbi:uncharacterized protein YjbJ (UPF0337 family) [Paraburkholderia sp. GAS448]
MNKDQVKGRIEEAKGKLKEVAGKVTGNETTRVKGKVEQVVGKTQALYGDAKEQFRKRPWNARLCTEKRLCQVIGYRLPV